MSIAGDKIMNLADGKVLYDDLRDRVEQKYTKPANGIPANDLSQEVTSDISGKANKTDTVLDTTLSRGRKANTTVGTASMAFGMDVEASGNYSVAQGYKNTASGNASHAEGNTSTASGLGSHSEGLNTTASGQYSHVEGRLSTATQNYAHAEGWGSTASGSASHAEGKQTIAYGEASHAEGRITSATGSNSHAEGYNTGANHSSQHVFGQNNVRDPSTEPPDSKGTYIEIVGNGTSTTYTDFSNARTLDWDGNERLKGDLYVECNPDSSGGEKVAKATDVSNLKEEVDEKAPVIVNSASGAIASFDDAIGDIPLKSCVTSLAPVQDLHGYDNPWPGGGGKNKCPVLNSGTNHGMTLTVDQFGVCTLEGQSDGVGQVIGQVEFTLPAGSYIANGGQADYTLRVYNKTDASTLAIVNSTTVNVPFTLASEKTIQVFIRADVTTAISSSGLKYYPMIRLSTESDATFAPYSNICPISGRTGVNVSHCGKNLFDTTDSEAGTLDADGNPISSSVTRRTKFILVSPNTVYTYSGTKEAQTNGVRVHGYDAYKNGDSLSLYDETNQNFSFTFTTPSDCRYIRVTYRTSFTNVQLELGESASEYEPYTGDIVNVEFPSEVGTVYGGQLDVTTGVLTVEYVCETSNGSNWIIQNGNAYQCYHSEAQATDTSADAQKHLCTHWKNNGTNNDYLVKMNQNSLMWLGVKFINAIGLFGEDITSENIEAYFQSQKNNGTPLYVASPLFDPITYQLTPVQILTLLGQNNIWADTGNIFVSYCADTKAYVDGVIPSVPVQDVQIDGTSILQNGVANVPLTSGNGSSAIAGVIKTYDYFGISINSSGQLYINSASSTQTKNGTFVYKAITPAHQHESAFYGLAKAAGADMASSSNAVGTYTDAAKIAIQKMLGIYQAPWELIREDTFTNETAEDHIITVDGNGNSFELTDIVLLFETPRQNNSSGKGDYGSIALYNEANYKILYTNAWTQEPNATPNGFFAFVENDKGMIYIKTRQRSASTNMGGYASGYGEGFALNAATQSIFYDETYKVDKINIKSVTGTGHYKLYGKRKWQ